MGLVTGQLVLSWARKPWRLTEVPMSQLVAKNRFDFRRRAFVDQSVVDDDMFGPGQAIKVAKGTLSNQRLGWNLQELKTSEETSYSRI